MPSVLTVSLVDDDKSDVLLFEHLCSAARVKIDSVYRSGEECVEQLQALRIDVLLVDLSMPNLCGPALIKSLREKWPRLKIVIWTGSALEDDLAACLRERINGYLLKCHARGKSVEKFADAMHTVVHGCGYYLDQSLYPYVFQRASAEALPTLSARETQVLNLFKVGLSGKQIASALLLSEETVKQYSESARRKCGAQNTVEAITRYRL